MTPAPFPRTPESPETVTSLAGVSAEFLHLLVEDLRNEIQVLRTQLDESEQECTRLREEMKAEEEGDRKRIQELVETLSQVSKEKAKLTNDEMEALSGEEAAIYTIQSLTRKVEDLSIKNTKLEEENIKLAERVQDLEGENEARQLKIGALEFQFKAINKTRQKAVQRLTSGSSRRNY